MRHVNNGTKQGRSNPRGRENKQPWYTPGASSRLPGRLGLMGKLAMGKDVPAGTDVFFIWIQSSREGATQGSLFETA